MELPTYPRDPHGPPVPTPDGSHARQAASALLVLESCLLGLTLPVQVLMLLSLGWEGGDEALKHRMVEALPLLGLGALLAAVLCGVGASAARREQDGGVPLVAFAAGFVAVLGVGWAATLQGTVIDPAFGPAWLALTVPAPAALALLLVVRRRLSRPGGSPLR